MFRSARELLQADRVFRFVLRRGRGVRPARSAGDRAGETRSAEWFAACSRHMKEAGLRRSYANLGRLELRREAAQHQRSLAIRVPVTPHRTSSRRWTLTPLKRVVADQ